MTIVVFKKSAGLKIHTGVLKVISLSYIEWVASGMTIVMLNSSQNVPLYYSLMSWYRIEEGASCLELHGSIN